MISKLDLVLQEKMEISNERDSLRSQLDLALKENEFIKSKNDCHVILKKNENCLYFKGFRRLFKEEYCIEK